MLENFESALEAAAVEGRNAVPDAGDDEAHIIEVFASYLLAALRRDLDEEHYRRAEASERLDDVETGGGHA